MGRKPIIAGIDPGTTLAYALLDFDGNVIATASGKGYGMSSLISEIIEYGKVSVVCSDKEKPSAVVMKVASSLGAKVAYPKKDLTVEEKRILVGDRETRNIHEKDALAAALNGYREIRRRLEKVDIFVEKHQKGKIVERRVILWISAIFGSHNRNHRQINTRRAILAFVTTATKEAVKNKVGVSCL